QVGRADRGDDPARLGRLAQVRLVPLHPVASDRPGTAADGVDLALLAQQAGETMAAEKSGGAGNDNAGHGAKSGHAASLGDIVTGGNGQATAKAGSFQRTPAAASGWNTSPIM